MEGPKNSKPGLTRRELLSEALGAGALAAGGLALYEYLDKDESEAVSEESGERFATEVSGYMAFIKLRHDEVVFVDENNEPVGPPVRFDEYNIVAPKIKEDGEVIEKYLYTPGVTDESGILLEAPTKEWRDKVIEQLQLKYPDRKIVRSYNVIEQFRKALSDEKEIPLAEAIRAGQIVTYEDMINFMAQKEVIGAEGYSRYEYVSEAMIFKKFVPLLVQTELKKLLPGLCAQESRFHNGFVSKADAKGIFQVIPKTWKFYGGTDADLDSLARQVEIAGLLFSDIYREVMHHASKNEDKEDIDTLVQARLHFASQEEFLRDFIVPLVINSYNTGSKRMGDAVEAFFTSNQNHAETSYQGKDLFLAIADFAEESIEGDLADYGEDSRQYFSRVYANTLVLAD